jgi:hypothetical protein
MTIPILRLISNFWRPQSRRVPERRHLMLAGINQKVFLNQWGVPEVRINLDHLEGSYQQGGVALDADSNEEVFHSVWIYVKQDRICFFANKRMVSHFKWSAFKEKRNRVAEKAYDRSPQSSRRSTAIMAHAISGVA